MPCTRTNFVMSFVVAGYSLLRLAVLTLRVHAKRA